MAAIKGVITEIGRRKLCEAHAGASRYLPPITEMAWGDGGVDETGTPKKVSGNEKGLYREFLRKKVDTPVVFANDAHTTARYVAELGNDEAIGIEVSELALYDSEGDMVVVQTFLRKGKDEGMPQRYAMDEIF